MFGQTIDARAPFSPWIALYLLIAAALIAWAALIASAHPLFAAALPLGVVMGLIFGRPQRLVLLVDNDGLRPFGTPEKISFRDINAVTVGGREYDTLPQSLPIKPMEIHHDQGVLVVPPLMNVDFAEFHSFLLSQVPAQPTRTVPSVLTDYLAQQIAKFGPEKVLAIHTRRAFTEHWRRKRRKWISAGIFLAAIVWTVGSLAMLSTHPRADAYGAWLAVGFWLGVGALVGYFAPQALNRNATSRLLAKHPNSCLIVAPTGIALIQGDTKGSLPWREITKVTSKIAQWSRTRQAKGVQLRVRGAEIVVFDIYERTPQEIEQLLRRNLDLPIR
jgi:hypothetical protein